MPQPGQCQQEQSPHTHSTVAHCCVGVTWVLLRVWKESSAGRKLSRRARTGPAGRSQWPIGPFPAPGESVYYGHSRERCAIDHNINRETIAATRARIAPHVRRTPIVRVAGADFGLPVAELTLKLELLQHSGSFKARGAFANLLLRDIPPAGIVAASGGNHGAAVAYAAMKLGIPATIYVPEVASPAKLQRIRDCGANLVVTGERYADALAASEEWRASSGALPIHAYDQAETLLGQGTVGRELEEQAPDLDTLLVAVGGGGLIGGIAAWYAGRLKLVGVEPELAPTLHRALAAGEPVDAPAGGIAADSLAPRRIGEIMFPIAQQHVDHVALVTDDAIRAAQRALWETTRLVAEPGGAAAFAALLSGRYVPQPTERIGILVCGGNTTAVNFDH
ncbi:MAG: threonine/serine dehydratase [Thermomicrobiales bacterium]